MSKDAKKTDIQIKMLQQVHSLVEKMSYEESATKKAFSTLYKELEQYKAEFVFKMEKDLLLDLLSFFDSLMWFQTVVATNPENTDENLKYLIDEFLEILRRRDVSPYPLAEKFDRKLHRILQVIPTEDKNLDGNIEAILRKGFFRGKHSLRDEEVSIYRLQASTTEEQNSAAEQDSTDSPPADNSEKTEAVDVEEVNEQSSAVPEKPASINVKTQESDGQSEPTES